METLSRLVLTFLLNAVWQVTLVAGVATACARLLRRAPARDLHAIWVTALALGALLPLSSLPGSWAPAVPPARNAVIIATIQPEVVPSPPHLLSAPLASAAAPQRSHRFLNKDLFRHRSHSITLAPLYAYAALSFYVLSLLCHLTRLGRAWWKTRQLRRAARLRDLPEGMALLVAQCRSALGLSNITILCSSQAPGPAAMGIRRPVIILPEALFQAWRSGELTATVADHGQDGRATYRTSHSVDLTAVLCHEMSHIRRHDYLLNLICEFIFLPLAFHPAAWLMKRRIDEARELACDEAAAGRMLSASAYAHSLLSLARAMSALTWLPRPRYTLGVFDANILEERIMRLLEKTPRLCARRAKLLLGGAALTLALAALAACAFSFTAQENAKVQQASVNSVDFSGRWELDKAKSNLPSPAPENLVQVIDRRGSELKITSTSKDWNVNKPIAVTLFAMMMPELSITADSRESVQPYGPGQFRSKSRWEGGKLITVWTLERDSQVMVTGQWVRRLSNDGKTQTVEITAHDPTRNLDGEAKAVFVKGDNEIMPGGPLGGVVGGVEGGVIGGVTADGPAGGAVGGVKGGVIGGVPAQGEKLTAGLSGPVPDPSGAQAPNVIISPELKLEQRVDPVYPPLAKLARVQGSVVLGATVGADGSVWDLKVESGHPLLVKAALEAVQQWKFAASPQLPATTTITFQFRLPKDEAGGGVVAGVPTQEEKGTAGIAGTVSDPSGARVPNAVVSIDDGSRFAKTTATNDAGQFSFSGLTSGSYELKVVRDGFAPFQQNFVRVNGTVRDSGPPSGGQATLIIPVGSAEYQGDAYALGPGATLSRVDIVLEPSGIMQSMDVTAKAPPGVLEKRHAAVPKRIRVGGQVEASKLVTSEQPVYPESTRSRGAEGTVVLEAVISMDGAPLSLQVLKSPDPELSEAALTAVRQWRYKPTLLNGEPIEVLTTITINFRLEE